jgi:hypothetical protein
MADDTLNVDLLFQMIAHWAATRPYSYYGSTYGAPTEEMLQKPLSSPIADSYLAKMREDIPVIGMLPSGTINLYAQNNGMERKDIIIEINGSTVSLADLGVVNRGGF